MTVTGNFTVTNSETAVTGINLNGKAVNVTGNFAVNGGKVTAGASAIAVGGNWTITSGAFVPGTSTVTFTATSIGKTITAGGSSFYNVIFNGAAGEWSAQDTMNITGNLTLQNGTFKLNAKTVNVGVNFSKTGGILNMVASSILDIAGNFTITGGTSSITGGTIYVGGNVAISGNNSFDPTTLYFYMDGTTDTTLSISGINNDLGSGTSSYFYVNKTDSTDKVTLLTNINGSHFYHQEGIFDVNGFTATFYGVYYGYSGAKLQMTSGTFRCGTSGYNGGLYSPWWVESGWTENISGGTIIVYGGKHATYGTAYFSNGSNFTPTGGTFKFLGWDTASIYVADIDAADFNFYNLVIDDAYNGKTVEINTNSQTVDIDGDFTIGYYARFNANGRPMEVAGSWINNGTFYHNNNTVTLDGASTGKTIGGISEFYNITINGAGAWTLTSALTAANALTLNNGTLTTNGYAVTTPSYSQTGGTFNAGASTITCSGNFSVTGGAFNSGTSYLVLDVTDGNTTFTAAGYTFYNVIFKNNSDSSDRTITLSSGTITFAGNIYLYTPGAYRIIVDAATNNPNIVILGKIGILDNAILNYSFETGDFTDWDSYFAQVTSDDAHTGIYSLDLQRYITWEESNSYIIQNLETSSPLVLSLWMKGYIENECDYIYLYVLDSNDEYQLLYTFTGTDYADWTEVTFSLTDYSSIHGIKLEGYNDIGDISNMLIDDISVMAEGGTGSTVGTINAGTGTWTVGGDVDLSRITFNAGSSTVKLNGSSTQNLTVNGNSLYNFTIDKISGSAVLQDTLDVNGSINIAQGNLNANGKAITLAGDWVNAGTFTHGNNTVTFNGTSNQNVTSNSQPFYNVTVNKASGSAVLLDPLSVTNDLTISYGTLNANGKAITLGGNWTNTGTFTHGNNTVTFNGAGTQVFIPGSSNFYNIIHSGAGTLRISTNNLAVAGTLIQSGGIFDANGRTVTVTGLTTVSGGEYLAKSGTQTFNGGLTISGGTFTGSNGTVDVNGPLTITAGTLNAPSGTFAVSGNWSKTGGMFNPGTYCVTFDGTG
ncbi:MAG: hypothetical protein WCT15_06960, partial [Candidatus Omnitrophota bacterium]